VDPKVACKAQYRARKNKEGLWGLVQKSTVLDHTACGGSPKINAKGASKLEKFSAALNQDRAAKVSVRTRARARLLA
jgi:hypothetical protein